MFEEMFPPPCLDLSHLYCGLRSCSFLPLTYSFPTSPLSQVSWLGLEENAEDPCKFTLTSRSSSGNIERYTLHSTSPGVCQVWIHQVSQILENQRNFLNGKRHERICSNLSTYLPICLSIYPSF